MNPSFICPFITTLGTRKASLQGVSRQEGIARAPKSGDELGDLQRSTSLNNNERNLR